MKGRALVVLIVAGGLAAALFVVRTVNYRRQQMVESGRFSAQYEAGIQKLQSERGGLENKRQPSVNYVPPAAAAEEVVATAPVAESESVTLQGISWNDDMPLAMINDRLYKTGEKIAGGTIEKILPYGIILRSASGLDKQIRLIKEGAQ